MKKKNLLKPGLWLVGLSLFVSASLMAQDEFEKHKACGYCGMLIAQYAHSRMLITHEDESAAALCSLHCAAIDFAVNIDKTPKIIQVGDYQTKKLIDAETAVWVIGGSKPGVMSRRGKWAFGSRAEAENFRKGSGGDLSTFEQAMKAAYEDMYEDTKMIRERRKMRRMKLDQAAQHQASPGRKP